MQRINEKDLTDKRLVNVNEITRLMGVSRHYFSSRLIKETNFLEIAPPVHLYENGRALYKFCDVLAFIDSKQTRH